MDKFISYKKSSKKRQKEIDRQSRDFWDGTKPFTRVFKDKKKYSRKQKHSKKEVNE